jgi:hypothetical protein
MLLEKLQLKQHIILFLLEYSIVFWEGLNQHKFCFILICFFLLLKLGYTFLEIRLCNFDRHILQSLKKNSPIVAY